MRLPIHLQREIARLHFYDTRQSHRVVAMAVGVSPGTVREMRALLARHPGVAQQLELEITETAILSSEAIASRVIAELQGLGVTFALDDFGTGYSSLAYLKRLPIQELKIDRSFVNEAPSNEDDGALVEAILTVASQFGLRVVAEGVETQEQVDFLAQRAPAMVYQGYLFGHPEPVDQWMARQTPNMP